MQAYARSVGRVLGWVLLGNTLVAFAKLYAGWRAESLAVLGDGLHSLMDAVANLVGLIVLGVATAPPDEDHPFGHSKYETLAAFVVSGLLLLTAFELAQEAVGRLFSPHPTSITPLTIGVMLGTLVINIFVAVYERRKGRELGSELLVADAAQTHGDVFVTIAVLGGIFLDRAGVPYIDPILALAVSGVIAYVAYGVFREVAPVLTDRVVYEPSTVARIVSDVPGVVNVHDIRSRGTSRESYVQMHLVVDTDDVVAAHNITDEIERRLEDALGVKEVLIHVEPEDDGSGPPGSRPEGGNGTPASGLGKG